MSDQIFWSKNLRIGISLVNQGFNGSQDLIIRLRAPILKLLFVLLYLSRTSQRRNHIQLVSNLQTYTAHLYLVLGYKCAVYVWRFEANIQPYWRFDMHKHIVFGYLFSPWAYVYVLFNLTSEGGRQWRIYPLAKSAMLSLDAVYKKK